MSTGPIILHCGLVTFLFWTDHRRAVMATPFAAESYSFRMLGELARAEQRRRRAGRAAPRRASVERTTATQERP